MSKNTYTIPEWQGIDDPYAAAANAVDVDDPASDDAISAGQPGQTAKTPKARYEILTASQALQPQPPVEWVIDGLVSAGSVNVFFGEGGSKKTWALLDMAVCVASGKDWLDFKTKSGNVLVIDEESGRRRIMRRLGDVLRGHNADESTPVFCVSLAAFDFGKPNDIRELGLLITMSNSKLVIVDALADVMPGRDENAVKDVQPIFLALRKIAEDTQAAIISIHHANKGGGYRGSTAIKGALDLLVSVESKTGSDEIIFKTEKARDTTAGNFSASACFMSLDPKEFWLTASTASPIPQMFTTSQEYVLTYLLKNGKSKINDIVDKADTCSSEAARKAVYSLAHRLLTERADQGGRGTEAEYQLTQNGQNEAKKL